MPPLLCPACENIALKAHTDPDTGLEIDACPSCHGLWFDANELSRFLQSGSLKNRFMWSEAAEPLATVGYVISTAKCACPHCKSAMSEKQFTGITLDYCTKCKGLWFDDGEVRHIVEKYKQGSRTGDELVASELKAGLGKGAGGPGMGVFASLMEFIKGMRE
ncbi:MAG: hypothetical protein FJX76_07715 [Armatimonadetes bacterium]|nr:hypothetical protein [Armatimonadota bacterium]